jgi:hypothetical protein
MPVSSDLLRVVAPDWRARSGPSEAVAWTTSFWLRDTAAGTTSNCVESAVPGATSVKCARSSGWAVQPSGSCSASLTWLRVWVPEAESDTVTVAGFPDAIVDGALTDTWREPGVVAKLKLPDSGRSLSAEESPTSTP